MMANKISVIIPTLNAEKELPNILSALHKQTRKIDEIIIVDSESTDKTIQICQKDKSVKLMQIARKEFDHGKTRDIAFRASIGDIVVFMTHDAVPARSNLIAKLITPLEKGEAILSTARQLPKKDASKMEQLVRTFNYPDKSHIRSKEDIKSMGIKAFFCSDVCAAYKRDVYFELGGFDYPIRTNEDMFFAAKVLNAGYKIAYVADALIYHSHNFTLKEQYQRNYIQGYEIERHSKELHNVSKGGEGLRLVKYVSKELLKKGHLISFIHFGFDCCARLLGSRAGKKAYLNNRHLS